MYLIIRVYRKVLNNFILLPIQFSTNHIQITLGCIVNGFFKIIKELMIDINNNYCSSFCSSLTKQGDQKLQQNLGKFHEIQIILCFIIWNCWIVKFVPHLRYQAVHGSFRIWLFDLKSLLTFNLFYRSQWYHILLWIHV